MATITTYHNLAYTAWSVLVISTRLIVLYLFYRISWAIYDVYFGRLSHIPGPRLAAATRLVSAYHRCRGNGELWVYNLHHKYGDVVRYTPNDISFAGGNEWSQIYGYAAGSRRSSMLKDPQWYDRGDDWSMAVCPEVDHARHRKTFSYAFSEKAILEQEPILQQYISQLLSNMRAVPADTETDMVKNYNFTTFDIMADLMFGEPLGCLNNSEYTSWVSMVFKSLQVIPFLNELNYRPWLRGLVTALLPPWVKEQRDSHLQHSVDRVHQRLANDNPRPDIFGLVARSELQEDQKLNMRELYSDAQLFMLAGTETTATLLSGVTYYLLTHPEKYEKVNTEIRSTFQSSEDIDAATVLKLPYMNACLHEAFRLYPPVPAGLPRIVGKEGMNINGYWIPAMTSVSIHQYSTYHNPKNFARPDSFIPERWLKDDAPPEFANDNRASLQPFSVGPRNCLGMPLAWMEMRLILTHVLFNFDMRLSQESRNWLNQRQYILWEKGPLMVTLKQVGEDS